MKKQRSFDWLKFLTTSMFVIGIGLILFSIFSWINSRESSLTYVVQTDSDVLPASSIAADPLFLQKDRSSEQDVVMYQDVKTQEDMPQIDDAPTWFESLDGAPLREFEEAIFDDIDPETLQEILKEQETDEFGRTPEQLEQIAADVVQELYSVVNEYKSVAAESSDLLRRSPSPEIGERWNNLKQRKIDLTPHVINLVWSYLLYTRDTTAFNPDGKIGQAIEGVVGVELGAASDGRPVIVGIYPNF